MSSEKQKITISVTAETKTLLTVLSKNLGRPVSKIVEEWVEEVLKSMAQQMTGEK